MSLLGLEPTKNKFTTPENDVNTVAVKFDQEKPKMSLVPQLGLIETAKVMSYGAKKYAEYNWMKGFKWTRLIDAAMRHLHAFNMGEDIDPESGLPHLAHAACCILMLYDITTLHPKMDDRAPLYAMGTKEKTSRKE